MLLLWLAEVQEVFSLFDKDGDGAIVIKELGPVLRSLGYNPAETEIDKLMEEYDADGGWRVTSPITHFPSSHILHVLVLSEHIPNSDPRVQYYSNAMP